MELMGFVKSLKLQYQRLPISCKTKMIRICRKIATSVILETSLDKFASVGDMITINLALLYRIGLPSNTATPLALFVGIKLLCFCICICQQTCAATNRTITAQIMTR